MAAPDIATRIGYVHIDVCELGLAQGKLFMFLRSTITNVIWSVYAKSGLAKQADI